MRSMEETLYHQIKKHLNLEASIQAGILSEKEKTKPETIPNHLAQHQYAKNTVPKTPL